MMAWLKPVRRFITSNPARVLSSVHPETPDETLLVSNLETRVFRPGKEIEGLRGGVRLYAAQACPLIDAARAEKDRFRMETKQDFGTA
jgi:hypothetical protein